jgi:UDP-3-O-[3-hydroxymyristoyl] glucosamine N-acyltransferase
LTAGRVADLAGGTLMGKPDVPLAGVASLERAGPGDLSLLTSPRYLTAFRASRAGAVLMAPAFRDTAEGPQTRIIVPSPHHALAAVLPVILPLTPPAWGIHPSAALGRGVRWQDRIAVGEGTVLGCDVQLGANCIIGSHVTIEDEVTLGDECRIHAHASLEGGATLGSRVVVHAGARIGSAGFGYAAGDAEAGHRRILHLGGCVIEDDVEVGANTTIDRGGIDDTVIGAGTKLDNLVQVAHHVRIGRRCLIMAQVGIAGSSVVEDDVMLAGQAGLADHLTVGRGARVAAQSGVIGDIAPGDTVSGYPARHHRDVLRQVAALGRLTPLTGRLERLAAEHDPQ